MNGVLGSRYAAAGDTVSPAQVTECVLCVSQPLRCLTGVNVLSDR
jgi:hypothetical protein